MLKSELFSTSESSFSPRSRTLSIVRCCTHRKDHDCYNLTITTKPTRSMAEKLIKIKSQPECALFHPTLSVSLKICLLLWGPARPKFISTRAWIWLLHEKTFSIQTHLILSQGFIQKWPQFCFIWLNALPRISKHSFILIQYLHVTHSSGFIYKHRKYSHISEKSLLTEFK